MTAIAFSSIIGPVPIECVISEKHNSAIEITTNPIETGAQINDHAYLMPKRVTLDIADDRASATYNSLVAFQESRIPFYLVPGLTVYPNMLVNSISADRDKTYSNVLKAVVELQEAIIVSTGTAAVDVGNAGTAPTGEPGGTNSVSAAKPTRETSSDLITADRATGTVQRGDARAATLGAATARSIVSRILQ